MRATGLVELGGEGHVPVVTPGTPQHQFALLTFAQLRERLVQGGGLTEDEADAWVAAMNDKEFSAMGPIMVAVWGRRTL